MVILSCDELVVMLTLFLCLISKYLALFFVTVKKPNKPALLEHKKSLKP